jgi:hypothetical protein
VDLSNMHKKNTFTEFKKDFYSKVKHLELFNCEDVNLIKVVLDGLRVDYLGKGRVRSFIFYPIWKCNFYLFLKRIQIKILKKKIYTFSLLEDKKDVKYIIIDIGRSILNDSSEPASLYFSNIIKQFKRKETCIVIDNVGNDDLDHDFNYRILENTFQFLLINTLEKKILVNLNLTYNAIVQSKLFDNKELGNIRFAFTNFFNQYRITSRLLVKFPNLQKAFFVCHYHKEGKIYALKKQNINCIELQHGLIAQQDIFYVLPDAIKPIKDRALFADKILVYGEYWKNMLLKGAEYNISQIGVIGYYLCDDLVQDIVKIRIQQLIGNKKTLLVTTQTNLHSFFIDYLLWLEKDIQSKDLDVIILLKPHPAENIEFCF